MNFIKLTYCFAMTVLSILITSCSAKPDISEFEMELKTQIESESNGTITLSGIEKTNSEEKEFFGQKAYSMNYKATIIFNENCWIYTNESGFGPRFESFQTYSQEPEFIPSFAHIASYAKKDQSVSFSGKVTYFETENGWVRK